MPEYDSKALEEKWQTRWNDAKLFEAKREDGKPKFFLVFAYPGISGYLHVGHMRGFSYADVICRYERMTGKQVLFPAGFHASGLPAIGLSKRVARGDENTLTYLRNSGTPEDVIKTLGDPQNVINYFKDIYIEDYWKKFGFTIDYSRAMTTISPGYKKFITWQFHKLKEQDLLTHKPHYAPFCPGCGPIAVDASQTDVSQGGTASINEFTVLKFKDDDGLIYPAATLRPETVFGVTNMFLHPEVEYVVAKVGEEEWLLSPEALVKIQHQKEGVEQVRTIKGRDLVGKELITPVTNARVPTLPGPFINPDVATGVVMSVPSHAPFDWAALLDIWKDADKIEAEYGIPADRLKAIEAIGLIITSKSSSNNPAKDICDEMKITTQAQDEELEEATGIIYKNEFHSGVLNDKCGEYSGLRVSQIKDTLRVDFLGQGIADVFFEFSEPVVCRCDTKVVIKKIPKQWFIRYSDYGLTERSKDFALGMKIIPKEYYNDMPNVLDWFSDRACIRQGSWLGTEFPFEEGWIIEPISDSTLYPAYYTVSKYVNTGELSPEDLTLEFFDYVYLERGGIEDFPKEKREIIKLVREDFDYWYPLDINLGGKEHKTVHFPVFLMNHTAILPGHKWPRGIFVNWWVTMSAGEKIAKSKGGAEPIPEAIEKYGVDAMRLYYCHIGSADLDIEWVEKTVMNYRTRIRRVWEMASDILGMQDGNADPQLDQWLSQQMDSRIAGVAKAFETYDLRTTSNDIYYSVFQDLSWYTKRGGNNKGLLNEVLRKWIGLMTPFTPHMAEELWEMAGGEDFASSAPFPQVGKDREEGAIFREDFLSSTLQDTKEILNIVKEKPKKVVLYTSLKWKQDVTAKLVELKLEDIKAKKLNSGPIIKELMGDEKMRALGKEIPKFVNQQAQAIAIVSEREIKRYTTELDELEYLNSAKEFLKQELGCEVEIHSAEEEELYDPQNKAKQAKPLRPAIYVEV